MVFGKEKVAVFVDGYFWHGCPVCNRDVPENNREYWVRKIERKQNFSRQKRLDFYPDACLLFVLSSKPSFTKRKRAALLSSFRKSKPTFRILQDAECRQQRKEVRQMLKKIFSILLLAAEVYLLAHHVSRPRPNDWSWWAEIAIDIIQVIVEIVEIN